MYFLYVMLLFLPIVVQRKTICWLYNLNDILLYQMVQGVGIGYVTKSFDENRILAGSAMSLMLGYFMMVSQT